MHKQIGLVLAPLFNILLDRKRDGRCVAGMIGDSLGASLMSTIDIHRIRQLGQVLSSQDVMYKNKLRLCVVPECFHLYEYKMLPTLQTHSGF